MRFYISILLFYALSFHPSFAQKEIVLVFYNLEYTDTSSQELQQLYELHSQYLNQLDSGNTLLASGTFMNGSGIAVFESNDIFYVKKLVEKDPALAAHLFRVEYFHTSLRFGQFCETRSEELREYNFVRYTSHITKYNVQHVPQLLKMHDDYLKKINATGNVAAEGVFANSDGGFIIIKGNLAQEVIMNDPTYQAGFTIPEIRNIFIAAGTFCEE